MFNVMIIERETKYRPKNIYEPRLVDSFDDLGSASACMFRLKDLFGKHYDVYINKATVK